MNCPKCNTRMQSRGTYPSGKQKYHCIACAGKRKEEDVATRKMTIRGNEADLSVRTHEVVKNERDLIRIANIDTNEWAVKEWEVTTWEAPRANKFKDLNYEKGLVTGRMKDEGKTTVVDLWRVNVKLVRKVDEKRAYDWKANFLSELKKSAPKPIKAFSYKKGKRPYVYELGIPDIQFGRLTWSEESGDNFDIKIADRIVTLAVESLLARTVNFPVSSIIVTLGNDYYNADNAEETTAHGTPQQEDTRWQKTFRAGTKLARKIIEMSLEVAPVQVVMLPGNHDASRTFFLGEVLTGIYSNYKHITVDNTVRTHKYLSWGRNLLGFAHGYSEKLSELPLTMATEKPALWGMTENREWHTGDKHHLMTIKGKNKKLTAEDLMEEKDYNGVTIRQLRSLAGIDKWTFDKLFIGTPKSAQSFMWDDDAGVIGSFYANINKKEYQ